jgi:hypothetical protein
VRLSLAKLQQDVGGKIVGGIFRMTKYWDIENVKCCMSDLVQRNPDKLPNCGIGRPCHCGSAHLGPTMVCLKSVSTISYVWHMAPTPM